MFRDTALSIKGFIFHFVPTEYQPPPAKKRLLSRNPFMDEDETPKKKQVSTLKSTNTSMNSVLDKLEKVDLSVLSPAAVIKAQYFIIQYLKVIIFSLFKVLWT